MVGVGTGQLCQRSQAPCAASEPARPGSMSPVTESPNASPPSPNRPRSPSTPRPRRSRRQGENVIGFGAGEPDFPTPDAHRRGRRRRVPRPEEPPYTPAAGPARAARGDRRQDQARLRLRRASAGQVLVTNGGKHAVFTAFAALCDPGDEVICPAPYWTTYPEAIALAGGVPGRRARPTRRPASGHRRPARGGAHAAHQGAAVRVSPTTRPARCTRPTRSRRSAGGRSSTASGSSPTRSTSTSPTATNEFVVDAGRSCPTSPTSASIAQRRRQDLRDDRLARRLDDRPERRHQGGDQLPVHATSNVSNVAQRAALAAVQRRPRRRWR